MGFLDDLKRQAAALSSQNAIDTAAIARNTSLVEAACKTTLQYFMELAPQLNVLKPKPRVRFSLDSRTPLEGLVRGGFTVDSRLQRLREQPLFDHVVLHGMQVSGQSITMTKDFPPEIDRLEARLRQAGITPDVDTVRDPDNNRLQHVKFKFLANITVAVKLVPDHDNGRVQFQMSNLDAIESVSAQFPAQAVTTGLLDELARWLTGEPHQFLKLGESIKRLEA